MPIDNLNLASLPPEIIFIIAGSDEPSLGEMRLISRSWNVSVLNHLRDNRYKPVLERVYFDIASEVDFDENDDNAPESEAHFKMWATVPERRAGARIGVGKWLSIRQAFPGSVDHVTKSIDIMNLASLPPEIISIVARLDEDSLGEMRLISRGWNASVLGHLSDHRYKPVLERVYFDQAMECDFDPIDDNAPEVEGLLKMWAIVPEQRAGARIGLGKWLTVHQIWPGVSRRSLLRPAKDCSEQQVFAGNCVVEVQPNQDDAVNVLALVCAVASWLMVTLIGCAALLIAPDAFSRYRSRIADTSKTDGDKKEIQIHRLTRFFDAFRSIDLVSLEMGPSRGALKAIGNRRIKRLHIHNYNCSDSDQEAIINLVRKNRIEHVTILACHCRKRHFFKFVSEVVKMQATLDIYERWKPNTVKYFERDRSYWDEKALVLERDGISMAISSDDETDFDVRLDEFGIRLHLRMRLSEPGMSQVSEYSIFQVESRGHTRPYN